jgi:hypothetical protein
MDHADQSAVKPVGTISGTTGTAAATIAFTVETQASASSAISRGQEDMTRGEAEQEHLAMTDTTNRSAEDIERELERRRSEIGRTADAIQDRLAPEAALDHALAYMRGPGGRRVLEAAQKNPLAAVLAAIGIGWLLIGMRQAGEDRGAGRPDGARTQEPPPVPSAGGPPSGTIKPASSPSPGAAAGGTTPL